MSSFLKTATDLIRYAVVAETVVGATTGVVPAPTGYFKAASEVCKKYGALFILDEVRIGIETKVPSHVLTGDEWNGTYGNYACMGELRRRCSSRHSSRSQGKQTSSPVGMS